MHGSDQAPDSAVLPVKRALARQRSSGQLRAEPARRLHWLPALGPTFIVASVAGWPATLAAATAVASGSAASAGSYYCQGSFGLSASPGLLPGLHASFRQSGSPARLLCCSRPGGIRPCCPDPFAEVTSLPHPWQRGGTYQGSDKHLRYRRSPRASNLPDVSM